MKLRDIEISDENVQIASARGRGWQRRRTNIDVMKYGIWVILAIVLVSSSGITGVDAVPVAQAETTKAVTTSTQTTPIITPSPSPTVTGITATTHSGSSTSSSESSSTTTSVPGTVVTDSPLVKTKSSVSAESALPSNNSSIYSNQSSIASATDSSSTSVTSALQSPTILQSPTTNDDGPNTTPQESTYNSLVNFYFLILAGAIAFAVLGWWLWRRRRKGKTTREQRRGLEALRRDLELGTFRRGLLGVVGRGGGNNPPNTAPAEELPAYLSFTNETETDVVDINLYERLHLH